MVPCLECLPQRQTVYALETAQIYRMRQKFGCSWSPNIEIPRKSNIYIEIKRPWRFPWRWLGHIQYGRAFIILETRHSASKIKKIFTDLSDVQVTFELHGHRHFRYLTVMGPRLNIKTAFPRYGDSHINPLRAKFFRGNINIYLHFVSFLHVDITQVVEILPQIRQEATYST